MSYLPISIHIYICACAYSGDQASCTPAVHSALLPAGGDISVDYPRDFRDLEFFVISALG